MAEDPEKLFLVEFLVESVFIQKHGGRTLGAADWMMCGPTVVTFQFMTFPTLEVVETDFPPKGCPGSQPQTFESGKSCLFSLPERVLRNAPGELIINVGVMKRLPSGCSSNAIKVGETLIDFTNEFNSIISDVYKNPNNIPASRSRTVSCVLKHSNETIGQIRLFIRLSCFGKLIITQFTLASGKSYLFKGKKDNYYKCQEVDINAPVTAPCGAGVGRIFPHADILSSIGQRLGSAGGGAGEAGVSVTSNVCETILAADKAGSGLPCEWFPPPIGAETAQKCGPAKGAACFKITKGHKGDRPPEPISNKSELQKGTAAADDAYVLRVGKRCSKCCDEKEQLEVELRAPPQRYLDTKETQWEDMVPGKGGKKGKGKKGKKGKGKKGKKGKKK